MGTAMMGTGEATGERRAVLAAEEAIANPLLDDVTLKGARGLLLSISGGRDMTLYEVDEAASRVRQEVDPEANIIVGATFDEQLGDRLRVSIVASGMNRMSEQLSGPQGLRLAAASVPRLQSRAASRRARLQIPTPRNRTSAAWRAIRVRSAATFGRSAASSRRSSAVLAAEPAAEFFSLRACRTAARTTRDSWIAPGNVMVEDGLENFPPLAGNALLRTPPLPNVGHDGRNATSLLRAAGAYGNSAYGTTSSGASKIFLRKRRRNGTRITAGRARRPQGRCRRAQKTRLFWTF